MKRSISNFLVVAIYVCMVGIAEAGPVLRGRPVVKPSPIGKKVPLKGGVEHAENTSGKRFIYPVVRGEHLGGGRVKSKMNDDENTRRQLEMNESRRRAETHSWLRQLTFEESFSLGYLLSFVRYQCTTNNADGYQPVEGSAFMEIWHDLSSERKDQLTENWDVSAQAFYEKVSMCYEKFPTGNVTYTNAFTTFTNSYSNFIADVSCIVRCGTNQAVMCKGLLNISDDFRQMIQSGGTIIEGAKKQAQKRPPKKSVPSQTRPTHESSDDIVLWLVFGILALVLLGFAIKMIAPWVTGEERFLKLVKKIEDWSAKNGFGSVVIEQSGKEEWVRFYADGKNNLIISRGTKPKKNGFYQCSWAFEDPKDKETHYICAPSGYQILFNPDTGKVEMPRAGRE